MKKSMAGRFTAIAVLAALLAFSLIALAAQFGLVLNARSTGVIDFNTGVASSGLTSQDSCLW
mgnify:CR=1 FL=1